MTDDDHRAISGNRTEAGGTERVGHQSGHRLVVIRHRQAADLTEDDDARMKEEVGDVHRHLAPRPSGDAGHSRRRASLMSSGHDPMKDRG